MKKWHKEEDDMVIEQIKAGVSYEDIAAKHERTANSIKLRAEKIVYEMTLTMDIQEVIEKTGMSEENVKTIVKKAELKANKETAVKKTSEDYETLKNSITNIEEAIILIQQDIQTIVEEIRNIRNLHTES